MNYQITEEQSMIVEALRAFLEKEVYPHESAADRAGTVSLELGEHIKQQAIELGFYAMNLPESVGGGGLDYTTMGLVERELGKASYCFTGFLARPAEILLACEGAQVAKYLAPCVSGEKHEVFALTEPGAGSDIMSMT